MGAGRIAGWPAWVWGLLVLLAAMLGGAMAASWVFGHMHARVALHNQPATVVIPGELPVSAEILDNLDILIDGKISTTVPVDQTLQVPIKDTLRVVAAFDREVPIKMTVPVRENIPVDQVVHVDSRVDVQVMGHTLNLPIRGDVPIKATVPVSIDVPVDQVVRLKFSAPTEVRLQQALEVPLKTQISATIPVHGHFNIPVRAPLQANITIPQPIETIILQVDLQLPLKQLGLHWQGSEQAGP